MYKKETKRDLALKMVGAFFVNGKMYQRITNGCLARIKFWHSEKYNCYFEYFVRVVDINITKRNDIKLTFVNCDERTYREWGGESTITINPKEGNITID